MVNGATTTGGQSRPGGRSVLVTPGGVEVGSAQIRTTSGGSGSTVASRAFAKETQIKLDRQRKARQVAEQKERIIQQNKEVARQQRIRAGTIAGQVTDTELQLGQSLPTSTRFIAPEEVLRRQSRIGGQSEQEFLEQRVTGISGGVPTTAVFLLGRGGIERPASFEESALFRESTREVVASPEGRSITQRVVGPVTAGFSGFNIQLRESITQPIGRGSGAIFGSLGGPSTLEEATLNIGETSEFFRRRGVSPRAIQAGEFISGFGIRTTQDVLENPLKQVALVGGGRLVGLGARGVRSVASRIAPGTGRGFRGVEVAAGLGLGAFAVVETSSRVLAQPTAFEAGGEFGLSVKDIGLFTGGAFAGPRGPRAPRTPDTSSFVISPGRPITSRAITGFETEINLDSLARQRTEFLSEFVVGSTERRLGLRFEPVERGFLLGQVGRRIEPRVTRRTPSRPLTVELDLSDLGSSLSRRRARLRSGADIFQITPQGGLRLTESLPTRRRPGRLTVEPDFSDLNFALSQRRARVRSGADIFKITPEGGIKLTEVPGARPSRRPLTFDLDLSDLGSALSRRRSRLRSGADIGVIGKGGQISIVEAQIKSPKLKNVITISPQRTSPLQRESLRRFQQPVSRSIGLPTPQDFAPVSRTRVKGRRRQIQRQQQESGLEIGTRQDVALQLRQPQRLVTIQSQISRVAQPQLFLPVLATRQRRGQSQQLAQLQDFSQDVGLRTPQVSEFGSAQDLALGFGSAFGSAQTTKQARRQVLENTLTPFPPARLPGRGIRIRSRDRPKKGRKRRQRISPSLSGIVAFDLGDIVGGPLPTGEGPLGVVPGRGRLIPRL